MSGKVKVSGNSPSLDTAERKRAEEELKSSEKRLKILFEFAPDAYYLSDLKGNFVDGNGAAEELTGYKREARRRMRHCGRAKSGIATCLRMLANLYRV